MDQVRQPGVFSHVRRSVRMTVGQQRVWETHWSELGRKLEDLPAGILDLDAWFGRTAPVVLEIGSGMGEATAQFAQAAPEVNHLAAEVYPAGLGQLMLAVEKNELGNVRLLHGDALDFLRDHVALLRSRLRVGGTLHCATDWVDYADGMLEALTADPFLANTVDGFTPRPAHRPVTKFEQRGLDLGHEVRDLVFRRVR